MAEYRRRGVKVERSLNPDYVTDRQRPAAGGAPAGTYAAVTPSEGLGGEHGGYAKLRAVANVSSDPRRAAAPDTNVLAHIRRPGCAVPELNRLI